MVLSKRIEKLERAVRRDQMRIVHVAPGQTTADAMAAHTRVAGPIPDGATVIVIRHTFTSAI